MVNFKDNVERNPSVVDSVENRDVQVLGNSPNSDAVGIEGDGFEPCGGIDFESHEAAYAFYQEYAKSMGFTTSIKNSRRSKKTKEFIDAKYACSRYGVTPESDNGSSRRPSVRKTDCKASMHVKRKRDGKWYIHEFVKEHNHELLPALAYHFRIHKNVKLAEKNNIDMLHAVSERTRKMYVEMSRQTSGIQKVSSIMNEFDHQFDRCQSLALEEGDAQVMVEYFVQIQKENPGFFYAIDLNEDQRLRNIFWVDSRNKKDYVCFSDVVCFDTSYTKNNERMPIALFIGVNHHCQPMLFGWALLADETKPTFVWLLKTWLRAMGGQAPKVIITDQDNVLKSAIEEVFPHSNHCFALWYILERIPETLANVIKRHENFMKKFSKCIFKSLTEEEFDLRWWKMVSRFELQEYEWIHSIYADRKRWVPAFMRGISLAGLSTPQRSESVNSFLDKYIQKKISIKELIRQYATILQNRYEEEDLADFETWHKQPALRSPSPWEKQMSTTYTHSIFKKFQIEVLGVVGCHPKKEKESGGNSSFRVNDCEKGESFMVTWNEERSEVFCTCLMFEYKGFLCRHAMIVLQIFGPSSIPSQYILKRWTKDAKNRPGTVEGTDRIQTRVHRYNDLCKRAIELSEEGSLSEENYVIACRTLVETLKNCVNVNNRNSVEFPNYSVGLCQAEEDNQLIHSTKSKKKSINKKRKLHSQPEALGFDARNTLQHMDNLSPEGISLTSYYGSQQHVHGLLNLMEPSPHDAYFVGQPTMQGLGHLTSIVSNHEGFYGAQQSIPGLGQLDFRQPTFSYTIQNEHNVAETHLHGNSRHI